MLSESSSSFSPTQLSLLRGFPPPNQFLLSLPSMLVVKHLIMDTLEQDNKGLAINTPARIPCTVLPPKEDNLLLYNKECPCSKVLQLLQGKECSHNP